ncbi:MAG: hypothetical protein JST64_11955 [Actinobacteria bacterium]|nr:hypothetical protein [Actinomycetota bacterium]
MVTAIGADPEALDVLARGLRAASGELDSTTRRIDAAITRSGWHGPDAERFRGIWQRSHRRTIEECSDRCRALARRIDLHAAEQRRASLGTGTPTAARHQSASPTSATVLRGVVAGSFGPLTASLAGTLTIEDLGDRRRVTYTDDLTAGAGTTLGGGARASWNDRGLGKGATAGAAVGLENRTTRTWTVSEAAVPMLLVGLAAEQGLGYSPAALMTRGVARAARSFDAAADVVGGIVGIDVPDVSGAAGRSVSPLPTPQRTEDLIGVVLGASTWAMLTGASSGAPDGAEGAGSVGFRVGNAVESDRRSLVFEADGAAAAAVLRAAPVLTSTREHLGASSGSIRVEVPVGSQRDAPVLITLRTPATGGEEVVRVAIDPVAVPEAARAARRSAEHLLGGDVPGALRSLSRLRAPEAAIRIETSHVRIDADRSAAEGVGTAVSLAVDGTIEHRSTSPSR